MFKELEDIEDTFETSFTATATLKSGQAVEVTIERKKRLFFVNGSQIIMGEGGGGIVFYREGQEYAIRDPEGEKYKMLHSGWFLPEHKICKENVATPTVRVVKLGEGDEKKPLVCIQWFGVAQDKLMPEACIPDGSQFLFSMNRGIGPKNGVFGDKPESFRVVFLGRAKGWLKPEAVQAMVDGPGKGNPEAWFVWLLSPEVVTERGPASPLFSPDLLGDPNCGIIIPKPFGDLKIRDEVMREFSSVARQRQDSSLP